MGKVVMYSSVSVDGFIADENDQPGPLFDWLSSGDVPLDESGVLKVSQTSYDYTRPYWDQIGATIVGRHVFDMTDGWDGKPPSGIDHVVVVTHRPAPEGWDPEAPFHFVDGVEAAVAKAQELAGDRMVEVAAGDVGGQVLAAGLVDEVRMDVVPVVFGSGKRYFGSVDAQHLLEDPDVVIQGNRVLHLRYRVRRQLLRDGVPGLPGPFRRVGPGPPALVAGALADDPLRFHLVLGPRRVGKTTVMYQTVRHLIAAGTPPERLWWLRMDHPVLLRESLGELVRHVIEVSEASPGNEGGPAARRAGLRRPVGPVAQDVL